MSLFYSEIYNPLVIISAIIGYQLVAYFFYQYYRTRKLGIKLNNILLIIGYFCLIPSTSYQAYGFRIYQDLSPEIDFFLYKFDIIIVLSALLVFNLITNQRQFQEMNNKKISLGLSSFILILMVIIIFSASFYNVVNNIYTILVILCGLYIFDFVLKFIFRLTGDSKKRFKIMCTGTIVAFIGPILNTLTYYPEYLDIVSLISALLIITGLIIMFFGIYNFSGLLEFDWQENLSQLYIISKKSLKTLYGFDFQKEEQIEDTPKPKVILGIDQVIKNVLESQKVGIHKIKHADEIILIEQSDEENSELFYLLLVKRDMVSLRYIIQKIRDKFQKLYGKLILKQDELVLEQRSFQAFDSILKDILNIT